MRSVRETGLFGARFGVGLVEAGRGSRRVADVKVWNGRFGVRVDRVLSVPAERPVCTLCGTWRLCVERYGLGFDMRASRSTQMSK